MKWIAVAALDGYIGLIILEALIPSLPAEKIPKAKRARVVVLISLGMLAVAFVGLLIKRWV
jgi:Na+-translocating ferredoxin:NAD+ oxidoreductase RnfA subunit